MSRTALLLIDLQNDYFPGGSMELTDAEAAVATAATVLSDCRRLHIPVFHVQHISSRPGATFFLPGTPGAEIHPLVAPLPGEPVIVKDTPNSFRGTDLLERLRAADIDTLVVCGMMTHMCVDTTVRAAFDYGFTVQLVADACATRPLTYEGVEVPAEQVQTAFLVALHGLFARVVPQCKLQL